MEITPLRFDLLLRNQATGEEHILGEMELDPTQIAAQEGPR